MIRYRSAIDVRIVPASGWIGLTKPTTEEPRRGMTGPPTGLIWSQTVDASELYPLVRVTTHSGACRTARPDC
jgi:hypothetical protein